MAEEIEVQGADESTESTTVLFTNDLSDELKERVKTEAAKRIEDLLNKPELSRNDLSQLSGVSHGSIKGRAKTLASAADIITAVLDGVRASGTRKPTVESVKSFLDSLSEEEKKAFIAQIQG